MPAFNFVAFHHFFYFAIVLALFAAVSMAFTRKPREPHEEFCDMTSRDLGIVFLMNAEGDIIYISPSVKKLFLYENPDILGKKMDTFVVPSERKKVMDFFQNIASKGSFEKIETRIVQKNGGLLDVEIEGSPLVKNEHSSGIQGIIRDVTEQKQMERKLLERNEELERINKLMIGREMKIAELKEEIARLKKPTTFENKKEK